MPLSANGLTLKNHWACKAFWGIVLLWLLTSKLENFTLPHTVVVSHLSTGSRRNYLCCFSFCIRFETLTGKVRSLPIFSYLSYTTISFISTPVIEETVWSWPVIIQDQLFTKAEDVILNTSSFVGPLGPQKWGKEIEPYKSSFVCLGIPIDVKRN